MQNAISHGIKQKVKHYQGQNIAHNRILYKEGEREAPEGSLSMLPTTSQDYTRVAAVDLAVS